MMMHIYRPWIPIRARDTRVQIIRMPGHRIMAMGIRLRPLNDIFDVRSLVSYY